MRISESNYPCVRQLSHVGGVSGNRRFPPYGRQLVEHTPSGKPPFITRILVYGAPNYPWQEPRNPWEEAKQINDGSDHCALILPQGEHPESFAWPVRRLICIVEHWPSRGMDPIVLDLVGCLIRSEAEHVIVRDAHFCCVREILK